MIRTPNRLAALSAAIESGAAVDLNQIAALQALDVAQVSRQFVEEAIQRHEETDEFIREQYLNGNR